MPQEEHDHLDDLNRSIYDRNAPDVRSRRKMRLFGDRTELKTAWERPPEEKDEDPVLNASYREKHHMSFAIKMLIGSAVFCAVALCVGAYIFLNGGNLISANNIVIDISGPISVAAGAPITLSVTITNNNNVALKGVNFSMEFPAGTTQASDTTALLDTYKDSLGDIAPHSSAYRTVNVVIYGEQNLEKQIKASVTYGIAGSSSTFTKDTNFGILISSSPIGLSPTSFKEITSGQPFDLTVAVKSNSQNTIKNVILKASYPFGFAFASASMTPASSDGTTFALGDIPPGVSRTLVIHGALTGEDSSIRAFHYTIGIQQPGSPLSIGTVLSEAEDDVTIQKPFVSLDLDIDGIPATSGPVGQFGRSSNVVVNWTNNLQDTLSNMVITVHLSGSAYSKSAVMALNGYFRSGTDDVVWNQQNDPELASVPAGATGEMSFTISPVNNGTAASPITEQKIDLSSVVTADRSSSSNVPGTTVATVATLKISSDLSLSGRLLRSQGPFVNVGPIPPISEQQSTYTVDWSISNSLNPVSSAIVTATLPPYVAWVGQTSPSTEDISYDKNSGTVTWNVGSIAASNGNGANRREAEFQVAFTPSVDQVGKYPLLVSKATLTATDGWTGAALTSSQQYLTTSFSTDPAFKNGDETVAPSK